MVFGSSVKKMSSLMLSAGIMLSVCSCSKSSETTADQISSSNSTTQVQTTMSKEITTTTQETTVVTTQETTSDTDNADDSNADTLLSDGPVFIYYTGIDRKYDTPTGFVLYHYSVKSGEWHTLFKYQMPLDENQSPAESYVIPYWEVFAKWSVGGWQWVTQAFDSKFERLAVQFNDENDKTCHVGWVDRDGNLTDVTNIAHPYDPSSFASQRPHDRSPLFTKDDKLVFMSGVSSSASFGCYDPKTQSFIENIEIGSKEIKPYSEWCLDSNDRPVNQYELKSDKQTAGVCFSVESYRIKCYGKGIDEPFFITPKSEWHIQSMTYHNEYIVFVATRDKERALFSLTYKDGVASDPVQILSDLDETREQLIFWSDKRIPVEDYYTE